MSKETSNLSALLKENGFSVTKQRKIVFNALLGQDPMSMHELIIFIGEKLDRASIYRTISLFEKLSIVQKLNVGWKYKIELTDKFEEHHHHLTCLKCGKVISINESELESFVHKAATENSFHATVHQIEIQGYCNSCANSTT